MHDDLPVVTPPAGGQGGTSGTDMSRAMDVLNADEPASSEVEESSEDQDKGTGDLPAGDKETEESEEPTEEIEEEETEKEEKEEVEPEKDDPTKNLEDPSGARVTYKDLRTAFPDIFKKFPALSHVIGRERAYSSVFPTVDDAKDASERAGTLNAMTEAIDRGDTGAVLNAIKVDNPKNLEAFSSNFLTSLNKIDRELYLKVTTPFLRWFVRSVKDDGEKHGNKDLIASAAHISRLLWGQNEVPEEDQKHPEVEKLEKQLNDEREHTARKEKTEFETSVYTESYAQLKSEIKSAFPKGVKLTEFVRSAIVQTAIGKVGNLLDADKEHLARMDKLWEGARRQRYSGDWKPRLMSTYMGRAKSVIPEIVRKLVAEALNEGSSQAPRREEKEEPRTIRRPPPERGRAPVQAPKGKIDALRKTGVKSELDFLNKD